MLNFISFVTMKWMHYYRWVLWFSLWVNSGNIFSQTADFVPATIAFYNVENLFDTANSADVFVDNTKRICTPLRLIEDGKKNYDIRDEDFTPNGKNSWDDIRFQEKIRKIAEVISKIGREETKQAPVIMGLSEIENRDVLEVLVRDKQLAPYDYQIVHFDSPDERGIDVALLYQKKRFKLIKAEPHELLLEENNQSRDYTRDILLVNGLLDGEEFYFLVNHWPSRSGGQQNSEPKRIAAGKLARSIVNNILDKNKDAKIILMGDLNDDPVEKSISNALGATAYKKNIEQYKLYNPYFSIYKNGNGTLAYQDNWNLFDQFILSGALLQNHFESYTLWKASIFNPSFILQSSGNYKNQPWRTFAWGRYSGGYSDHLPVYCILIRNPIRPSISHSE